MLCSTVHEKNGEKEYIDMLNRQMMDGIIMGTHSLDIEDYNGVVRPIVSLGRYTTNLSRLSCLITKRVEPLLQRNCCAADAKRYCRSWEAEM